MRLEESDIASSPLSSLDARPVEDEILESLSKLRLEIFRIETTTGPSKRTVCIREEIKRLEIQLATCKEQAKQQPAVAPQDKP
jgi:hypothetical protein